MKNLQGRSAILDVHAVDSTNKEFDVEIQRADKGAGVKRARYFKQDKEGVAVMCKMMEDIADYTELSIEIVNELANQIRQLV